MRTKRFTRQPDQFPDWPWGTSRSRLPGDKPTAGAFRDHANYSQAAARYVEIENAYKATYSGTLPAMQTPRIPNDEIDAANYPQALSRWVGWHQAHLEELGSTYQLSQWDPWVGANVGQAAGAILDHYTGGALGGSPAGPEYGTTSGSEAKPALKGGTTLAIAAFVAFALLGGI